MIEIFFFAASCFLVAFFLVTLVLLERLKQAEIKRVLLKRTLAVAYGLIIRHHAVDVAQEWGVYCKVCHRADGTEPELDEIAAAIHT